LSIRRPSLEHKLRLRRPSLEHKKTKHCKAENQVLSSLESKENLGFESTDEQRKTGLA